MVSSGLAECGLESWGRFAKFLGREVADLVQHTGALAGSRAITPLVLCRETLPPWRMKDLLETKDRKLVESLYSYADAVTKRFFGKAVFMRGIIEFSNVCVKDCYYCGIRSSHPDLRRFTMTREEILECCDFAQDRGYGSVLLQSGELHSAGAVSWLCEVVSSIKSRSSLRGAELGVALSVGEHKLDVLRKFREAGAHRYLLRIETSNPDLYSKIHPSSHKYDVRVQCLRNLKAAGFALGTGVMVGIPKQTVDDLVGDICFFRDIEADMIGLGPYIPEYKTPLGKEWLRERADWSKKDLDREASELFDRVTRMYALSRISLGNVNIAATTALQVLNPMGREIALSRGCNVMMPILTPKRLRQQYVLYEGKPCVEEGSDKCAKCLRDRVFVIGREFIADGGWHDPPSYEEKKHLEHEVGTGSKDW